MGPALPLVLAVALGVDARIEAGIGAEAHARVDPGASEDTQSLDLTAVPHLALTLKGAGTTFSAAYALRLTGSDVGPNVQYETYQEGQLRLHVEPGTVWSLEGFASAGAGRTDLLTQARNPAPGDGNNGAGTVGAGGTGNGTPITGAPRAPSTIPTTQAFDQEYTRAGLGLRVAPDRRSELVLSGAASTDGGTNAEARLLYPVAREEEAFAEYRWHATRRDELRLRASAFRQRIAAIGTTSAWASALGIWSHQIAPDLELRAAAGGVALDSRFPITDSVQPGGFQETHQLAPAGELGLTRNGGRSALTSELVGTFGGTVDRLTGLAWRQAVARANLKWPVALNTVVRAGVVGALSWPQTGWTRRGDMEMGLSYAFSSWALLDLGIYASWQSSTYPPVPDLSEYGAVLTLSFDVDAPFAF